MGFSEALYALKQGKKIARSGWGGYWYYASNISGVHNPLNGSVEVPFGMKEMVVAVLSGNSGTAPAQPYQADLLAEDWQIVE